MTFIKPYVGLYLRGQQTGNQYIVVSINPVLLTAVNTVTQRTHRFLAGDIRNGQGVRSWITDRALRW